MGLVACLRVVFDSGVCGWSEIALAAWPGQNKTATHYGTLHSHCIHTAKCLRPPSNQPLDLYGGSLLYGGSQW